MKYKIPLLLAMLLLVMLIFGCSENKQAQTKSEISSSAVSKDTSSAIPPVAVTLNGEAELVLEAGQEYVEQGAVAEDNSAIIITGSVNTSKAGEYAVCYSADTKGSAQVKRTVKVVDNTPPVITLNGNQYVTVSAESFYKDAGAKVYDLGDPDVKIERNRSAVTDGVFTVTYTATDFSGNTVTATRTVTIKDIVKPTIKLTGSTDMYVVRDTAYNEPGFSATDDLDGDLTLSVTVSGAVDTAVCGAYTLTYTVMDKAGNIGTVNRVVHIYSMQSDCPDRVYLTFDDGPNPTITPQVLDALKRNDVKATFFITDYTTDAKIALVKRIVEEGHTLAIHSYSHDYATCYASDDAYMNGLQAMHDKIYADTGYDARIIRFPGGTSNTISRTYCSGIMSRLVTKTVEAGYSYFDWNVDSGDASGNGVASSTIYNNVTKGLRRGRNNVVLMHDDYGKSTTVAALDDIINYCKANGYALLPITTDTVPVRHKANN